MKEKQNHQHLHGYYKFVDNKNERSKKRLVIDYSDTINRFTELDAHSLPKIVELVNTIAILVQLI